MVSANDVSRILAATPTDWHGTTFANKELLGREAFATKLSKLLSSGSEVNAEALEQVGNAEDYLRVASNVSTLLEMTLASTHLDGDVSRVFTFASGAMPIVAASLAATDGSTAVHTTIDAPNAADAARARDLAKFVAPFGVTLTVVEEGSDAPAAAAAAGEGAASLKLRFGGPDPSLSEQSKYDAVCDPRGVLYILNKEKVTPERVLLKRKRMATPITTPAALLWLNAIAEGKAAPTVEETCGRDADCAGDEGFLSHLREICGAPADAPTVVCTAGLPTLASLWVSLAESRPDGVDIVMCATAYGGSSQLADVLSGRSDKVRKHTFPLTGAEGGAVFAERIDAALSALPKRDNAGPVVVFIESPSNPDMKVPAWTALASSLERHAAALSREIAVMVDTTLSPTSKVLTLLKGLAPSIPAIAFVSLSKSVSRGRTTGGTLVANDTDGARAMVSHASATAKILDLNARPDQWRVLAENHTGVEERVTKAHEVASSVAEELRSSVDLPRPIAFVSEADAKSGFTPSTFSFNLPAEGAICPAAQVAQKFVDLITEEDPKAFKPCVSFGQDNGLVYATVPATSTQGAIAEEHKDKQAVGGVQLVRLSFAPGCDVDRVRAVVRSAISTLYSGSASKKQKV